MTFICFADPGFDNNLPTEKLTSLRLVSFRTGSEPKSVGSERYLKNSSKGNHSKSASHPSTLGTVTVM